MINEQYKYSELTSKIIVCAIELHKRLGNGFLRTGDEIILQEIKHLQSIP